jgi:glycosyltransferase involved in cell wall biosynthesis
MQRLRLFRPQGETLSSAAVPGAEDARIEDLLARLQDKEEAYRLLQARLAEYGDPAVWRVAHWLRKPVRALRALWRGLRSLPRQVGQVSAALRQAVQSCFLSPAPTEDPAVRLQVGLNEPVPTTLAVGHGTAFYLSGWCYHPQREIRSVEITLLTAQLHSQEEPPAGPRQLAVREVAQKAGAQPKGPFTETRQRVVLEQLVRRDLLPGLRPEEDQAKLYGRSFEALITLPACAVETAAQVNVRVHFGRRRVASVPLTALVCQPGPSTSPDPAHGVTEARGLAGPRVAVCMATCNPPLDLFRRQIQSLRKQTYRNWVCYISDDASDRELFVQMREIIGDDLRFVVERHPKNVGFYQNFARALHMVGPEEFVALADQDDRWYPGKLATLLAQFDERTTLVYSDMRLTDPQGNQIAPSFWQARDNNWTRLRQLVVANTVTGAASMFRRSLLPFLLPFPPAGPAAYHDHWIAGVALALGEIRFVSQPLYDYVQHDGNVTGARVEQAPPPIRPWWQRVLGLLRLRQRWRSWREYLGAGRRHFVDTLWRQQMAHLILLRCQGRLTHSDEATLRFLSTLGDSWTGLGWLCWRHWRRRQLWRHTLGTEGALLSSVLWKSATWARSCCKRWLERLRWSSSEACRAAASGRPGAPDPAPVRQLADLSLMEAIRAKIKPLALHVRRESPARVNLLLSVIDFKYLFGGYLTVFHLARRLAEQRQVRLVILDPCDFLPAVWKRGFQKCPGLQDLLDRVDLVYTHDRRTPLVVSPRDVFLATNHWAAHVAHDASRQLGQERFVYLIQEWETGFHPLGVLAAFADQSYDLPHYALFSTELLREYFRRGRLGVYRDSVRMGERRSASFENAITVGEPPEQEELAARTVRKLLFYCRPEEHARRNLFELGILSLVQAIEGGAFPGEWEFHGIGSVDWTGSIALTRSVTLRLLPKQDLLSYRRMLSGYDVGLSLMYTPHPSLVPLEMAASGMLTVTNTFANKTPERLQEISTNLLPVEGTVEGVTAGLREAAAGVTDFERRLAGTRVHWSTTWDEAWNPAVLGRLREFLAACQGGRSNPVIRKVA